jgi:hypothetical protein
MRTTSVNVDYNTYEGKKVKAVVESLTSRAKVVTEDGAEYIGKQGDWRFLKCGTCVGF